MRYTIMVLSLFFTLIISVQAATVPFDIGVDIDYPAGWHADNQGQTIYVASPDGSAHVIFTTLDISELATAATMLEYELKKFIDVPFMTTVPRDYFFHTAPGLLAEGTGRVGRTDIQWIAGVISRNYSSVLILCYTDVHTFNEYSLVFENVMRSVRVR